MRKRPDRGTTSAKDASPHHHRDAQRVSILACRRSVGGDAVKHAMWKSALCLFAVAGARHAHAQHYPAKPVRLIVPYPPGGGTDPLAPLVRPQLPETLGQQVIMHSRPGAGVYIALEPAARA